MLIKKPVIFMALFAALLFLSNNLFAAENLAKDVLIKTKPKTKKKKRIRLTDTELDKIWKGKKGKNILKINLGEVRKINQVRFKVKKDVKFKKIVLKAWEIKTNKTKVYKGKKISGLANTWITLTGFNVKAQYLKLKLKKKRPKFFELEVCYEINDLNNDGFADLLMGAPAHAADGALFGRAYVVLGGENLSSDMTLTIDQTAYLGWDVDKIGDVNNDGYGDFIVTAPLHSGSGIRQGQAYIYLGGPSLDARADLVVTGDQDFAGFGGVSLLDGGAGVGDVNGDGVDDFAVNAYAHDGNGVKYGQVFLYFGDVNLNSDADLLLSGDQTDSYFGSSVAGLGDVNDDGVDDFIIGASGQDTCGASGNRGRAYVYFGGSDLNESLNYPNPDLFLEDPDMQDDARFGWALAGVGDINGDGENDFIVGAPGNDAGGSLKGKAYIYYGGSGLGNVPDLSLILPSVLNQDLFGWAVAGVGDINGDGENDFIIGAPGHDGGGSARGAVYVFYGGVNFDATPDLILYETEDGAQFGFTVEGVGDVNGDGFDDFIIGAPFHDADGAVGSNRGRAYLYYGGANPDDIPDAIFNVEFDNALFGFSTG